MRENPIPHDIEKEKVVLAMLMLSSSAAEALTYIEQLNQSCFHDKFTQHLFNIIVQLVNNNVNPDPLAIAEHAIKRKDEIIDISAKEVSIANIDARIHELVEIAKRREIYLATDYIANQARKRKNADKLLNQVDTLFDGIKQSFTGHHKLHAENCSSWLSKDLPAPDVVLQDSFDKGTKIGILAPSKARKSFFLLHACLCLVSGQSFLSWTVGGKKRVLLVQLEVPEYHYHKRVKWLAESLEVKNKDLDKLYIANLRGFHHDTKILNKIQILVKEKQFDVIAIDPFYKLITEENQADSMKVIFSVFDDICNKTGAAVIFTHHYGKGIAGDRETIDRGVGSGVLQRDIDAGIWLTPHQIEDLWVVEQVARSYPPKDPFTVHFDGQTGLFQLNHSEPIVKTSVNKNRSGFNEEPITEEDILDMLEGNPRPEKAFIEHLRKNGYTYTSSKALIDGLVHDKKLKKWRDQGRAGLAIIGLPEDR